MAYDMFGKAPRRHVVRAKRIEKTSSLGGRTSRL